MVRPSSSPWIHCSITFQGRDRLALRSASFGACAASRSSLWRTAITLGMSPRGYESLSWSRQDGSTWLHFAAAYDGSMGSHRKSGTGRVPSRTGAQIALGPHGIGREPHPERAREDDSLQRRQAVGWLQDLRPRSEVAAAGAVFPEWTFRPLPSAAAPSAVAGLPDARVDRLVATARTGWASTAAHHHRPFRQPARALGRTAFVKPPRLGRVQGRSE